MAIEFILSIRYFRSDVQKQLAVTFMNLYEMWYPLSSKSALKLFFHWCGKCSVRLNQSDKRILTVLFRTSTSQISAAAGTMAWLSALCFTPTCLHTSPTRSSPAKTRQVEMRGKNSWRLFFHNQHFIHHRPTVLLCDIWILSFFSSEEKLHLSIPGCRECGHQMHFGKLILCVLALLTHNVNMFQPLKWFTIYHLFSRNSAAFNLISLC